MLKNYSVLGVQDMKLPSGWQTIVWSTLGFFMFLSGVISGDDVSSIVGAVLLCGGISAYLTSYFRSERRVKRAAKVATAIIAIGLPVSGYVLTGNFLLGIMTLLIVVLLFAAFTLSYLLPKIRHEI
jgi:hypothetical protein